MFESISKESKDPDFMFEKNNYHKCSKNREETGVTM